jgi:hypothetical protein
MSEGTSSDTNQLGFVKYDPIKVRKLVVQYFINEELPFRHVESCGFRELMNGIPCHITLQKDCMKLYEEEKLNLKILRVKEFVSLLIHGHLFKI